MASPACGFIMSDLNFLKTLWLGIVEGKEANPLKSQSITPYWLKQGPGPG
jgi:hypothetical protein